MSVAVACRLRSCNSLLRHYQVIENVKYFRHVCMFIGCGLIDGCCTDSMNRANRKGVLRGKHCYVLQGIMMVKAEHASETLVSLYQSKRGHNGQHRNFDIHRCGNLKLLCCFAPSSFPLNPTQSVYTQHGTKQTHTECC